MAIVSVQSLTKAYGNQPPALRDVTLEVDEGVTGLLGPNGAGKSTLLQCVLGLLPDFEGQASVLGLDARADRRAIRRRVGFMPEADSYFYDMKGIAAVRYLGQLTGMPRNEALRRAHETLHHVGLGEAVYRQIREYSTGMRQRFKLAQALVHDPELIFLDEPLAGMDPQGRTELIALIGDLARNHGKHIIWSSHLLPDVQKVADAVMVLHRGRSRGTFRIDDLRPRIGLYTVEVEGAFEPYEARLREAGAEIQVSGHDEESETPDGGLLARRISWSVNLPESEGSDVLFKLAHECGARVRRVTAVSETLEEVFHRVLDEPTDDHVSTERTGGGL